MRGKLIDVAATNTPFVFGRAHEADLCVMDRELSRRHGAILYVRRGGAASRIGGGGGSFILVDLESTVRSFMLRRWINRWMLLCYRPAD
jgi:hypothetical protein